jgi:hypothetical protein
VLLLQSCWLVVHGKVYDVTDFLEVSSMQLVWASVRNDWGQWSEC